MVQWYGLSIDIDERKLQKIIFAIRALSLPGRRKLQPWLNCQLRSLTSSTSPSSLVLANAQVGKRWLAANPPNLLEINASIERIKRDARAADRVMQHIRGLSSNRSPSKKASKCPGPAE
jgi:hypothetical protein